MLITCPDCARQVSDVAPICLGCGRPIAEANYSPVTANAAAMEVLDILNTIGRMSIFASKLIAERIEKEPFAPAEHIAQAVRQAMVGSVCSNTKFTSVCPL